MKFAITNYTVVVTTFKTIKFIFNWYYNGPLLRTAVNHFSVCRAYTVLRLPALASVTMPWSEAALRRPDAVPR